MVHLILPTLVLLAAWGIAQAWFLEPPALEIVAFTFRGLATCAFLLAVRFGRGRLGMAVALLVLLAEAKNLTHFESFWPLLTALTLLGLVVIGWEKEWPVISVTGGVRFLVLAGVVGSMTFWHPRLVAPDGPSDLFVGYQIPTLDVLGWNFSMPHALGVTFVLVCLLLFWAVVRNQRPFSAGLLGMAVALALASEAATPVSRGIFFSAAALILALSQIESAFTLAFEDGLTRLPARRALEESLLQLGRRYAIAMVDLDHFKLLNDRHGHEVGDQVLRMVAHRLAKVGGGGRAFRYGGEEFTVLFPRKSAVEAQPYLQGLCQGIAEKPFVVRATGRPRKAAKGKAARGKKPGRGIKVTVSIGVAERNEKQVAPEQVMKAADKALYRAKKAGRNRVAT